jgi:hypothetical protein
VGRVLQRLLVCLAFAGVFLLPALARAALVPACDAHEQLTRMPAPSPPELRVVDAGLEDACSVGSLAALHAPTDELGDVRVAAMCDPRGASVIAPQRILPVSDARIEAPPACEADSAAPAVGPGSHHAPVAGASVALADHAVLDPASLIPPPSSELAPAYPPVLGGPRSGFRPGVDHPPR